MKVDVVQSKDVKFKWYQWYSDWIDICIFDFESTAHILQMSVSRTNAKTFRCVPMHTFLLYKQVSTATVGDLVQMGKKNE